MEKRIKHDNLPISRELKIEQFRRELDHMEELLAHFHDELLNDNRDADIMYSRIWLQYAYEHVHEAIDAFKGLQWQINTSGKGLTELADKASKS